MSEQKQTLIKRFLNRDAFKTPPKLKLEDVSMPEFGEGAFVRIVELSAEDAQKFGTRVSKEEDRFAMPLWIIATARETVPKLNSDNQPVVEDGVAVYETGAPLFEDSKECRQMLLDMGASITMRLGNTALKLCGFTKEETEKETKN